MKKYELSDAFEEDWTKAKALGYEGALYRIRALKGFTIRNKRIFDVEKGDIGGIVSSEENLSQDGTCWISDNAMVLNFARVTVSALVGDNAYVGCRASISGSSAVMGKAVVKDQANVIEDALVAGGATISGTAVVGGSVRIYDGTFVGGCSEVRGNMTLGGQVCIYLNAVIEGDCTIAGYVNLSTDALIKGVGDFLELGPASLSGRTLTAYRTSSGGIHFATGCFSGDKKKLLDEIAQKHGESDHAKRYRKLIEYAEDYLSISKT